ncbi:hypothetical protein IKQ21_04150 [bacterium]|nr:hypothetical protein [bacterium]
MPTNIRIRRGNKANLPNSAPSGMPLWCEDTKELYIGTGNGIQIIHTYDADTVDGYHASSFLQSSKQFKIVSGSNTGTTTYVYPPDGYTMSNLVAFIPSIRVIHYNGDVDNNDSMYCTWSKEDSRITVKCYNSEQRANPQCNYLAVWRK